MINIIILYYCFILRDLFLPSIYVAKFQRFFKIFNHHLTHMTINIGVVQFPGSNTERETSLAIKRVKMNPVEILWNSKK